MTYRARAKAAVAAGLVTDGAAPHRQGETPPRLTTYSGHEAAHAGLGTHDTNIQAAATAAIKHAPWGQRSPACGEALVFRWATSQVGERPTSLGAVA